MQALTFRYIQFLADPKNAVYNLDVRFASTYPEVTAHRSANASSTPTPTAGNFEDYIIASRFLVQVNQLVKAFDGAVLMDELRILCDGAPFNVFPYYYLYDLYDQASIPT